MQDEGWDGKGVRKPGVRNTGGGLDGEGMRRLGVRNTARANWQTIKSTRSPDVRHAARPGWMRLARQ